MISTRFWLSVVCLLALGLVVTGCGSPTSGPDWQISPLAQVSPLPAPTFTPTVLPTPTFAATKPMQLVVLHTNDNWGATEPCG